MTVARTVADVLDDHVSLEIESIDRMYLNLYIPRLQRDTGVVSFFREHRGKPIPSGALMAQITEPFVAAIHRFIETEGIPLVDFKAGERKDDIAKAHLARFTSEEGVLFVGRAQEKTRVFRSQRRRAESGRDYVWIVPSTAMVNAFYFYCVDRDFGPFFLKYCSYFPYNAKLYVNGHEWAKRQAQREGIDFEALDNGFLRCSDPKGLQSLCRRFGAPQIRALVNKWMTRLPYPFAPEDTAAGYRYEISILQAEFALTQVFDAPFPGRIFFEQVIRDNLDLGRPDQVSLIFDRRVTRRTPGRFRTRVITEGVTPSLHVDYKRCRVKQYHKEGRALRTETTVNDTRDFAIGKRLQNLPALREIGFNANRRLLRVQKLSHDPSIGEAAFKSLTSPVEIDGQRAAALRFGHPRVSALFQALLTFHLSILPQGFSNRDLRDFLAPLLDMPPGAFSQGRMTYDLRRLRLHGLIERIPRTHRYRLTQSGLRTATLFTHIETRTLRPALAEILIDKPAMPRTLRTQFDRLQATLDQLYEQTALAA